MAAPRQWSSRIKRLLVVDDEPSIRELIREYFSGKGYDVTAAATGEEGLDRLREARPHLMLLDILLPDIDGMEVLRRAKAIDPAVGIIMLTGLSEEAVGREALQAGAFDYFTKPIDLKHLDRVVCYKLASMLIG